MAISKEEYEKMMSDHEEGLKKNDYSKMIMAGSEKDKLREQYLIENRLCNHDTALYSPYKGYYCRDCGTILHR